MGNFLTKFRKTKKPDRDSSWYRPALPWFAQQSWNVEDKTRHMTFIFSIAFLNYGFGLEFNHNVRRKTDTLTAEQQFSM